MRQLIRRVLGKRTVPESRRYAEHFRGKTGLEIGGPSAVFTARSILPVYALAKTIDNCNFGATTL